MNGRAFLVLWTLVQILPNCWAIVGGIQAKPPEPDDPVVFCPGARVEGLRKSSNGLYSFLGVPFATVGQRFTRPIYKRLSGDLNATIHAPPCVQPDARNTSQIVGVEDCLVANVFTPKMPGDEQLLPVIVWIHGGGFRYGSASQYGPDPLTDNRVVFVAIQYRLGTLGILGSGEREFPGNLALLDCAMALRWVSEHIEYFGGDPKNLKVMGQGSGAVVAMHLSTTAFSKPLISGVIAMSGSLLTKHSVDEFPDNSLDQVAKLNDCTGKSDDPKIIIRCLRERKLKDLIEVDNILEAERLMKKGLERGLTGFLNFLPHIEMKDDDRGLPGFLTESPNDRVQNRNLPSIPLLIGVNKQETANGIDLKGIQSAFGTVEKFLKQVTSVLGLKDLMARVPTAPLLDLQLPDVNKYLTIPENSSPMQILTKVTEVTTDVLFNLPATVIADAWSKTGAPAFLYQFDYSSSNAPRGRDFLGGLPLVSKNTAAAQSGDNKAPVGHGDELAYLFDVADIHGQPIRTNQWSARDLEARKRFAKVITDFVTLPLNATKNEFFNSPFSNSGMSFIEISDTLKMKSDFRFCELSLWGAHLQPSSGKQNCKNLLPIGLVPVPLPAVIPGLQNKNNPNKNPGFLGFL